MASRWSFLFLAAILILTQRVWAAEDCSEMEAWDETMAMCMPRAMAGMPMSMLMVHGQVFAVANTAEAPRGRNTIAAPNMVMADLGTSVGNSQYINVDLMGTLEKWTFPKEGSPLLGQIGEENQDHQPFIDAQHPHSSPIMGLTLSDTISLEEKNSLKIFVAPRGEATEGPMNFMHRLTGKINPDAPLGHHIGQDVGHIVSTLVGASLSLNAEIFEASIFNGTEPSPTQVDLPVGTPNSEAVRWIHMWSPEWKTMVSYAYVKNPEPHDPDLDHITRTSASVYTSVVLNSEITYHNTLIYGLVNNYDQTSAMNSVTEEFLFERKAISPWGRLEFVQRTPAELIITTASDQNSPRWWNALTLGATMPLYSMESGDLFLGASVTKNILPSEFRSAYGGDPLAAKIFLQLSGHSMWDLQ